MADRERNREREPRKATRLGETRYNNYLVSFVIETVNFLSWACHRGIQIEYGTAARWRHNHPTCS